MKRLILMAVMVVVALILGGCMLPGIVDPVDPVVVPVEPILTIPVAAFSYYSDGYPVQTGSQVWFDGSASYDPDGEIMWGKWDFDDGTIPVEGIWTKTIQVAENGKLVWCQIPVRREPPAHVFANVGTYKVRLTVVDNDGNESSTTRKIRVW